VENLEKAVKDGDLKASVEVIRAVGLYGYIAPVLSQAPERLLKELVESELRREGDPEQQMLINLARPHEHRRRPRRPMAMWRGSWNRRIREGRRDGNHDSCLKAADMAALLDEPNVECWRA
jgi:hypothetical protein